MKYNQARKMAGQFHAVDYVVFFLVMAISLGIGVLQGFTGGKQKTTSEYLLADKSLPAIPVAMSICVSLISSNTVLGVPAEVYNYGITYVWWGIAACVATVVSGFFFVPLFYPLGLTSIYEYLELRYGSKAVRLFAVVILIFHQIMYVGTVIFGPATALSVATGIDDWLMILICAAVGTIYTAVGGIKAVVYTDVFQCVVMIIGQLIVIGVGIHKVGGASEVWELNKEWNRLQTDTSGELTVRASIYSTLIGGFFLGIAVWGTYQPAVQRALGCPTQTVSTISYIIAGPLIFIAYFIAMSVGWVVFAYYADKNCDPLEAGDIKNVNQLLPQFLVTVVDYPGIPGVFFAAVVCSSLSSLSSSVNSVAAVVWDDCLKGFFPNWSEEKKASLLKLLAVLFGMICLGGAYIFLYVGGTLISIAISIFGALQGPIMAVMVLACLVPFSNWIGALVSGVIAVSITVWMMIGRVELGRTFQRLPVPTECDDINDVTSNYTTMMVTNLTTTTAAPPTSEDLSGLDWFYAISLYYYSLIALIIVLVIGSVISLLTGYTKPSQVPKKYLGVGLRKCTGSDDDFQKTG